MTDEQRLFLLQEEYIKTKDKHILGQMMADDLLPNIARLTISYFKKTKGLYCYRDDYEDLVYDASLLLIQHIEKGNYVKESWYGCMRSTVSSRLKKLRKHYEREITFGSFWRI